MLRTACLAGLAALAGCGGGDEPASPAATPAATASAAPVVAVAMHGNRFLPARIVVHAGQTIRWTNDDPVAHTVASSALRLASEGIRPGDTFSYRPARAGRFPYYCTIHAGQRGVLIVRN